MSPITVFPYGTGPIDGIAYLQRAIENHVVFAGSMEMGGGLSRTLLHVIGRSGEMLWAEWDELRHAVAVIGTVLLVSIQPRYWGRPDRRAFVQQIMAVGVESIRFVCGVAVFVGITVVMHLLAWFWQAGHSQMLGRALVIIVARELSPTLVSLVIIMRSGSAMATELAIMKVDGRVHALKAQGVSPFRSLVVPRVLSVAVSTFCLTIAFMLVAFVSGYLFGAIVGKNRHDLLLLAESSLRAMGPKDMLAILGKSALPGLYAGTSCCIGGLEVGESLADVPWATQRALARSVIGLFVISTGVTLLVCIG